MCKEFIYNPSPIWFNVNSNHKKFLNILLSICEVMIAHSELFPNKQLFVQPNNSYLLEWVSDVVLSLIGLNVN
jgi:hypothetical protein